MFHPILPSHRSATVTVFSAPCGERSWRNARDEVDQIRRRPSIGYATLGYRRPRLRNRRSYLVARDALHVGKSAGGMPAL
jgi:hypothetical protein